MTRYLITTADERTWKFDRPVLFLGEWCRLYDRKHIWAGMDATVAEPYGLEAGQKARDFAYVRTLSSQLLVELTDALNAFHQSGHGVRYWQIVLGHWLLRYVSTVFNRYATLEQALKTHDVGGTTILDATSYSLATTDSLSFTWASNDDVWNHVLCSRILAYWNHPESEVTPEPLRGAGRFVFDSGRNASQRPSRKDLAAQAASSILRQFSRRRDGFLISTYLPTRQRIALELNLGQCPQAWRTPPPVTTAPAPHARERLAIDATGHDGFEQFVRRQVAQVIPSCYVEGYRALVAQTATLGWPEEPKFIFTSNRFDMDELFKVWTASRVERGVPYIAGQHGANYGTHIWLGAEFWPERAASDRFITWGWSDADPRNVPGFVFTMADRETLQTKPDGGLLLMEFCVLHRITSYDVYAEYCLYQDEQFRFVEALPEGIRRQLLVRLHGENRQHRWFDEQRWRDRSPGTRLEAGVAPFRRLLGESRLVVHSYDSTGILETLRLNIPTLCFWQGGLDHLLPSAKPYYEHLRTVGILLDTPEGAAAQVASHWDDVGAWWQSAAVQQVRKTFCDRYARAVSRPVRTLKRLLIAAPEVVADVSR